MFKEGDLVEATRDITAGFQQAQVMCEKGTKLVVNGKSHNGLHPISVKRADKKLYSFSVSEDEIRKV